MNRFQKMRKVCKGYLERIPPLLMQGFQWGADWLREKILDLGEYLKRNSLRILALNTPYVIIFYLVDKEAWLYQYCQGDSSVERLMAAFEFSNGIYFCSAQHRKDAITGRFYRGIGCKTSGYDEDEKCQKVPTGRGVWFGKMGNCKRHCTLH